MASPTPLDLPRLLLRASALVLLVMWLLAAALGLWRAAADAEREMGAAMALMATMRDVANLQPDNDAALVDRLRASQGERWRHLRLTLRDADGQVVFGAKAEPLRSAPVEWMVGLLRRISLSPDPAPVAWSLPRGERPPWTLVLSPSPDTERREAVVRLFQLLSVLGAGALLLLALLRWQLHRAFRPLRTLVEAISAAGSGGGGAPLPPMPVRELQVIAEALAQADAQRRLLAHRLQTLQEDERRRLAQELHDELGQRLTALRMDATVLRRGLQDAKVPIESAMRERLANMAGSVADQVGAAQSEVRELLARLAPRADERVSTARLTAMLQSLVRAQRSLSVELRVEGPGATIGPAGESQEDDGEQDVDRAVPQAGDALLHDDAQGVDRSALQAGDGRGAASASPADLPASLMLAVYRLSQEGLTNVVRHARARCARLTVRIPGDGFLHWQLADDGVGLPDIAAAFERGSGLAGMRERVWAFGGHLEVQDAQPGLLLQATLRVEAQPPGLSIATP